MSKCIVSGCQNEANRRNICDYHYKHRKQMELRDDDGNKLNAVLLCSECMVKPVHWGGLCHSCHHEIKKQREKKCSVSGCGNIAYVKGFCKKCYERFFYKRQKKSIRYKPSYYQYNGFQICIIENESETFNTVLTIKESNGNIKLIKATPKMHDDLESALQFGKELADLFLRDAGKNGKIVNN